MLKELIRRECEKAAAPDNELFGFNYGLAVLHFAVLLNPFYVKLFTE